MPVYLHDGILLWQLYGLRFSDQYGWARAQHAQGSDLTKRPDPDELSVDQWSNFYRSGDYVGRSLWHQDADLCIGAGAHTHYWDKTAPKIAEELDFLIGEACSRKT